jgi:hypothetical protein
MAISSLLLINTEMLVSVASGTLCMMMHRLTHPKFIDSIFGSKREELSSYRKRTHVYLFIKFVYLTALSFSPIIWNRTVSILSKILLGQMDLEGKVDWSFSTQ